MTLFPPANVRKRVASARLAAWLPALLLAAGGIGIYLYPYLRFVAESGLGPIPPIVGPDLYFYLTLARLPLLTDAVVPSPWYGIPTPAHDIMYGRFGLALWLMNGIVGIQPWGWNGAMMMWTALWTGLIWLAARSLFQDMDRTAGPEQQGRLLAAVLATLFIGGIYLRGLAMLANFAGGGTAPDLGLPFSRPFYPQTAIAPLLACITVLAVHLRSPGRAILFWLPLYQFLALLLFPYACALLLLAAGFLAIASLGSRAGRQAGILLLGALALSTALDLSYLLARPGPATGVYSASLLLPLDLDRIPEASRAEAARLLALGAVSLALLWRRYHSLALVLAAILVAELLLQVADGVVDPMLRISHHARFLSHPLLNLCLLLIVLALYRTLAAGRRPAVKALLAAGIAVQLAAAPLVSHSAYHKMEDFNRQQQDLARQLAANPAPADTLTLATPSASVDEVSVWHPLVSRSPLLYSWMAEFVLPRQDYDLQRERQAMYLYLTGWNSRTLADYLARKDLEAQDLYLLSTRRERPLLELKDLDAAARTLTAQLVPRLAGLETDDAPLVRLFCRYQGVRLILPDGRNPFIMKRLERLVAFPPIPSRVEMTLVDGRVKPDACPAGNYLDQPTGTPKI